MPWRYISTFAWLLVVLLSALECSIVAGAQEVPSNFEELAFKASAAREQNDVSHAIELYGQAVKLKPDWPDGWWFLGSLQYHIDAYAAARDALTRYLELKPAMGPALALRGLCEFELGVYPQSLIDIQQGLSLGAANESRNAEILRYHEALLLTKTGRFEDALQRYSVVAKEATGNAELFAAIGLAGLRAPLLPIEVTTDQRTLFVSAGNAAFQFFTGSAENAKAVFEQLFARFPQAANAHYLYGYLLFATDPDEAVMEFKREVEVGPANPVANAMIAWDSLLRNNPSEALPYAQKAAAGAPELTVAQLVLGRAMVETGNISGGMEHLQTALHIDSGNIEVHIALAKAYSEAGRKDDAMRERRLCLQIRKAEISGNAQP